MGEPAYDIGIIGLGVMGRNLALNMLDHGFGVAGFNRHLEKVSLLLQEAGEGNVLGAKSLDELAKALQKPRVVMMMVPAGRAVDEVIDELLPYLDAGDLIIDGGNSHYKDTDTRAKSLGEKRIHFLGVGISGGEKGARRGPSIMPGGPKEGYERVRNIFEAVAAKVDGEPCVTYLGPGSAGHYVKVVHNGIEYALMQLIAETYDLMKRSLGLSNDELAEVYESWNNAELQSFLIEITAGIFRRVDDKTGSKLIDEILDRAGQKGTGKWTSQDAMDLQVPVPTIDTAVSMRDLSGYKDQREAASGILSGPTPRYDGDKDAFIGTVRNGLYAAMITTYAQGMALLQRASDVYDYGLALDEVARIWSGGCIIRACLLEDIRSAFQSRRMLPNLMLDAELSRAIMERHDDLRQVIRAAVASGIPVSGFMASLGYLDAFRSGRLPANLIQAQRDFFGSHTYERIDEKGTFHTIWDRD